MDFTMKDYESLALHTATADTVNVQHKKPFDIADVDNNAMKLEVITAENVEKICLWRIANQRSKEFFKFIFYVPLENAFEIYVR